MDGYTLPSPIGDRADEAPGVPCIACPTCGARHLSAACPLATRILLRLRRSRAAERTLCQLGDLDEVIYALAALVRQGTIRRGHRARWELTP